MDFYNDKGNVLTGRGFSGRGATVTVVEVNVRAVKISKASLGEIFLKHHVVLMS